ncbi:gliding motility-associated ABC transporter ATP-binding subunit GldA [Lutibacter citreus]|uniref:gliding motility-associated ABC transporter ATP-binding subunit GldA n=1 Tax=Lutibacter citreus TaxID=2138210 RepID=UPI000DBE1369|nr:gliding motility-associated ABC transporter ATP-binding subunit GldA [Lutibacter citreus]
MSIEVKNISKRYGSQLALDNVSFSIKEGEIVGFLGPNGAGKSTMMKILTGYIQASEGEVFVNDLNLHISKNEAQKNIGYLPEHNPLYLDMYVKEYLLFNARIHKIPKSNIEKIIDKVGLTNESHKKISQLSKGYRQRVGLAASLLHNPNVVILDEPTTGLDPNQLLEIRNLIKEIGKEKTVLFSTHIMQEVEAVCDRVIIINKGKIIADELLKDLKENQEQLIEVEFDFKIEKQFIEKIPNLKIANNSYDTTWELTFSTKVDMRSAVFDFAKDNGLKTLKLNAKNKNLESLFRELTT